MLKHVEQGKYATVEPASDMVVQYKTMLILFHQELRKASKHTEHSSSHAALLDGFAGIPNTLHIATAIAILVI